MKFGAYDKAEGILKDALSMSRAWTDIEVLEEDILELLVVVYDKTGRPELAASMREEAAAAAAAAKARRESNSNSN